MTNLRWLALVIVAGTAGCGETCETGESTCYGDQIRICGGSDPDRFETLGDNCGADRCLEIVDEDGLRQGVCTTSGEPDARCTETAGGATCVDSMTLVYCNSGYSSREQTCASICVVSELGSDFCTVDPEPSSRCTEDGQACEPNALIRCNAGYVVDRVACGTGACVTATEPLYLGDHLEYCVDDAACEGTNVTCDDDLGGMSGCVDGRLVDMTCNPGTECSEYTVNPTEPEDQWRSQAECYPSR